MIYSSYADDKLSLWEIKEGKFLEAQIQEIACAISHAFMDIQQIPYDQSVMIRAQLIYLSIGLDILANKSIPQRSYVGRHHEMRAKKKNRAQGNGQEKQLQVGRGKKLESSVKENLLFVMPCAEPRQGS